MKRILIAIAIAAASHLSLASEYCVDQYNGQITNANSELGKLVARQNQIDKRLSDIYLKQSELSTAMAAAATKSPPDIAAIQALGKQIGDLNREKADLESEGYKNQDRIVALKVAIPAELQGRLRGCIEASAPANRLVNLAIQALAIISTGGASLTLPPKSLYVDMSAVLNGYPTGGSSSVINEAREAALKALPGGLGNPNNDVGRIIRDPGSVVRCIFGC
jgi:hypothetical protein